MQDPIPTRPTDPASTSPRDLLAGYEAHLTPLSHTRLSAGKPEQVDRPRAVALDAPVRERALADRLMPMRWASDADALPHGASAVHASAALELEIAKASAGLPSCADRQHQQAGMSAAARDEGSALLDAREVGR